MKAMCATKQSRQILADFEGCEFDLRQKMRLKKAVRDLLVRNRVHVLKTSAHCFPHDGMTLVCILAESHLALHTWPEKGLVNVDLFLCNYSRDNADKVKGIEEDLVELLRPKKVSRHTVMRLS